MRRLDELAGFSEVPGQPTRHYLCPAHLAASRQVAAWVREAGMGMRTDALYSVFGRYEGRRPQAPAIMASHLDIVLDAGRYDGALGVLVAVGPELMDSREQDGISEAVGSCARKAGGIGAYLELRLEQGPVLEQGGLGLGAVTAINGSHRLSLTVSGFAGHAGTVPMSPRRDALSAASEVILAIERLASSDKALVATVGHTAALPGAQNVIPGKVRFSIEVPSPSDAVRQRAHRALLTTPEIAAGRGVAVEAATDQTHAATPLDDGVIAALLEAIAARGQAPLNLPSGAGHAAGIMARHGPAGMIFLRCKDGISHNPAGSITAAEAEVGVRALPEARRRLAQLPAGPGAA